MNKDCNGNILSEDSIVQIKVNKHYLLDKYGLWWLNVPKPANPETFSKDNSSILVEGGKWYVPLDKYLTDLVNLTGCCSKSVDSRYVTIRDPYFIEE